MFVTFFHELKAAGVPVTLREYLTLMEAMEQDLAGRRVEDFYYLSRAALVKDERNLDKFDRVFGHVFKGLESRSSEALAAEIPAEWLKKLAEKYLTEEEKKQIEAMGGLDKLLETLRQRLREQKGRHQGGRKWIGTAGTSPFGAYGYNPEGVRIGQDGNRNFRAVKVWDKREFKDLDDQVELGTRNIKLALRRLRKFARTGAPEELDLDGTIKGTAHKGYLDILMRPERHNSVKVLLFFDVGGSMDWHVKATEELFSAARTEFKHMEHFYFHNCLYERVWKENRRRFDQTTPTWDVLHTYPHDYKVIFVGDASMSPYEIMAPGGSVEHFNEEAGAVWMERVARTYPACVWLNPVAETRVGLHPVDPHDAPADGRADVSAHARGARPGDAGAGALKCLPTISRNASPGAGRPLQLARRADPPAHAGEVVGERDVGDASDQVGGRHHAVRRQVAAVDAGGAIVPEHEYVPCRNPGFRHVRERRLRAAGLDIRLLDRHPVDDRAPALDRDPVALDRDDAPDVVQVWLPGVHVDRDLAPARLPAAVEGGVGHQILAAAQRRRHAGGGGTKISQLPRGLGVGGIEARNGGDHPGAHERGRVDLPPVVRPRLEVVHPPGAHPGLDQDEQPQPEQHRKADGKHPETGQHPHHREHQQRVGDHHQHEEHQPAPRLSDVEVAEAGGEHRQQHRHPRRRSAPLSGLGRSVVGERRHGGLRVWLHAGRCTPQKATTARAAGAPPFDG